jgi:hypothetical protein
MSADHRKPARGPYRIGDVSTGDRNADLLRDPQVAAFAEALTRIRDPQRRALVEYLVREFARRKMTGGP